MSKVTLKEGDKIYIKGSGKNPYEVKMTGGVISCSCPAWRNQSLAIDQRTCKHIKANVENGPAASTQSGSVVAAMEAAGATVIPTKTVTPKNVPPCLLAHTWDGEQDVSGWIASPKLDGVRAWWDGEKFWSRLGNEYHAPEWFKKHMPKGVVLDGELFAGNKKFAETISTVKKFIPNDEEWKGVKYHVFDAPKHGGTYEQRLAYLQDNIFSDSNDDPCMELVPTRRLTDGRTVESELKAFEQLGYEGVMLRQPGSMYEEGRSHTLLKHKSFFDMEVTVVGYNAGKKKNKGKIGSLQVKMADGKEFDVNLPAEIHKANPPSIDSLITISYQELTKDGIPRFATFVSARDYE